MTSKSFKTTLVGLVLCLAIAPKSSATPQHITSDPGKGEVFARGGMVQMDHNWTWTIDGGLRIGLPQNLEVFLPLAMTWAIIREAPFQIGLSAGVTDFWPAKKKTYLYTPAVVITSLVTLSHEAAAFFSLDYTHIQTNFRRSPGFIRGAGALMVDMGPYLTWSVGISYQTVALDRTAPAELQRSGLAGRRRVSIGSVRATPYAELPLIAIHPKTDVDITINGRFDIDANAESMDARFEGGMRYRW